MCPLRVPLLCALLSLVTTGGSDRTEIVTEPESDWTEIVAQPESDWTEIVAQLGSEVTLAITVQLSLSHTGPGRSCDDIRWRYRETAGDLYTIIASSSGCRMKPAANSAFPNVVLSENGSLIIHSVTERNQGEYYAVIYNSTGYLIKTNYYRLHVEVPVSVPLLNISCLPDGNTWISCRVENGTSPSMILTVNGGPPERNASDHMTITKLSPGPLNVTCSAENRVSKTETNKTKDSCPVPLSSMQLNTTCFLDGRAEAFCWVHNGSDPHYSWSLDGRSQDGSSQEGRAQERRSQDGRSEEGRSQEGRAQEERSQEERSQERRSQDGRSQEGRSQDGRSQEGRSQEGRSVSYSYITLPPPVSGLLRCDAGNVYSNISKSTNIFCPVPVSDPILEVSCMYNNSADISCRVDRGSDPRFTLTVNSEAAIYNVTSAERRVSVTLPPVSPPLSWNVTCFVQNSISYRTANRIHAFCTDSLSAPVVIFFCQNDGSATISCVVETEQDVTYNWTVSGKPLQGTNSANISLSTELLTSGALNVGCSVTNAVTTRQSNSTSIFCQAVSCLSCLEQSLIGGTIALIVTLPPLFIYHWYALPRSKKRA